MRAYGIGKVVKGTSLLLGVLAAAGCSSDNSAPRGEQDDTQTANAGTVDGGWSEWLKQTFPDTCTTNPYAPGECRPLVFGERNFGCGSDTNYRLVPAGGDEFSCPKRGQVCCIRRVPDTPVDFDCGRDGKSKCMDLTKSPSIPGDTNNEFADNNFECESGMSIVNQSVCPGAGQVCCFDYFVDHDGPANNCEREYGRCQDRTESEPGYGCEGDDIPVGGSKYTCSSDKQVCCIAPWLRSYDRPKDCVAHKGVCTELDASDSFACRGQSDAGASNMQVMSPREYGCNEAGKVCCLNVSVGQK